jgi:hypothetical protein
MIAAIIVVAAMLFVNIQAQASLTDTVTNDDSINPRIEPTYSVIAFTFDIPTVIQRWDDSQGWYIPATGATIDDSKVNLSGAANVSLDKSTDASIYGGMNYEVRILNWQTSANSSLQLKDAGASETISIYLAANAKIYYSVPNATSPAVKGVLLAAYTAGTWYRIGIEYTASNAVTVYALYDNCTEIASASVKAVNVTYAEIDQVNLAQTVGAKQTLVDFFYISAGNTETAPLAASSRMYRVEPTDKVERYNIAYNLDDMPSEVTTFSNYSSIQDAANYTPTGITAATDRKINDTDTGNILAETQEDAAQDQRGKVVAKGWADPKTATEDQLQGYLEDKYDTANVWLIDYYMSECKLNMTLSDSESNQIKKSAMKNWANIVKDNGGETSYVDDAGLVNEWHDIDYTYVSRDVTSDEFAVMRVDLSNEVRKDTISMVGITAEDPNSITEPYFGIPALGGDGNVIRTMGTLVGGPIVQFTNLVLGNAVADKQSTVIDMKAIDLETGAKVTGAGVARISAATQTAPVEDGKATTAGLAVIGVFAMVLIIDIIIIVAIMFIALAVIGAVFGAKKHKEREEKK